MNDSNLAHANWMLAAAIQRISCAISSKEVANKITWTEVAMEAINEAIETIQKELPF